ncbi:SGNH/GDSL hydrolase family protein [Arthrobacter sp. SD76]|uniref:SGNH/GDSL hydrolase family protein n=1 Tax=Arthrobacter sp. SD76 TaxID=3415007 RepID=UPI003C74FA3B
MRKVARFLLLPLLFFFIVAGVQPATAARYPTSMAALGDSITQATDVCCWYGNHPAQSWSTGNGRFDGITSHYERLLQLQPDIAGKNFNNSRSGAKASDLPRQAQAAVSQGAEYVTILIGANDVCTSSISGMTEVETFREHVNNALQTLDRMRPRPQVFVSSIPNIYQLWSVLKDNEVARLVWSAAQICQSMLASTNTPEMRQQVLDREIAFNAVLEQTCVQYKSCRTDGGAVFGYAFNANDVSRLDYFHPSLQGQANLAEVTWKAAW